MATTPPLRFLKSDSKFLKTMRQRRKLAGETDTEQDKREQEDIAFEDGKQWDDAYITSRQALQPNNGMPAVPARPTLVIDKVKEPVRQILNQERSADIGVELVPADDFGDLGITPDDTEITLREGLIRRIQRESKAADARTWAYKRAVIAGRGYYMVMTRYLPGRTSDQEVYVHRIYNQAGVKLDPSHEQPDGSDADWAFVGTWVPYDRFIQEHNVDADGKKHLLNDCSDAEFLGLTESYPDWYQDKDGQRAVRLEDYFYTERTMRKLATMDDGTCYWDEKPPEDATPEELAQYLPEGATPVDVRTVVEKQIKFSKIAGGLIELERTDWAGPDMPIIKVIGDEVLPYDNQRRYSGMIRTARGAQQGLNYMISKQVESIGLTPLPSPQLDPNAIEGYEDWYKVMNTRALPYRPYRTYDDHGRQLSQPVWSTPDPNIYPIAQSIAMFSDIIKSQTISDPGLGNANPSVTSGKHAQELIAQSQQSTSNYLDNLSRSIRYEGQIENNLLFPIYGRPGRLVRILTGEGESQTIQVGDAQDQGLKAKAAKVAKLTKDAHFNVIVKVTRQMDSRRQQEASALGELISAAPEMMGWFGDLYLKNSDTPNRNQLAERARVMLVPPIQALLAKQEQGQTYDPQAQAQISQLQQQLQQLSQQAQEMSQALQTKQIENQAKIQSDQIKAQADLQRTQAEIQRDIQLQRMQDATSIRIAEINAELKGLVTGHEAQHEAAALHQEQAHEVGMAAMRQEHERQQAPTNQAEQAAVDQSNQQMQAPE